MADIANPELAVEIGDADRVNPWLVRITRFVDRFGVLFLVLLLGAFSWLAQPDLFLTPNNIANIFRQTAFLALLALGQFIVIVTAGIDLSVGSTLALAMMSTAVLSTFGLPWPVLLATPFLVGLAVGAINGLGLTWLRMPHPFIMTLGTLNVVRGLTNLISGGVPISGLPPEVRWLGAGNISLGTIQLPVSVLTVFLSFALVWVFLEHTRTGRHIYAIGGNPQAARVSGVNVDRTLVLVYALCGLLAGFAGLLLAGRTNSGFPNAGIGAELDAISAVIIGGASFFGGRGTVLGVFAGVLVIGMMRNLLNLSNVQVFWQQVLIGLVIIGVVAFDVVRRRASAST